MSGKRRSPDAELLFQLVVVVAGLVAGVSVWAYSTFETQEAAEGKRAGIEKRLDRIENKVDELLRRSSGR